MRATVSHIIATEGMVGLVRGLVPTVLGVAPARAVYFGAYANVKASLAPADDAAPGPLVHLCSAAAAGFTTATAIAPIFMVKTRMQLLGEFSGATATSHRLVDTVKAIYAEGGIAAFYRVR